MNSGVAPSFIARSLSAPASSSARTTASCPFWAATYSGVAPVAPARLTAMPGAARRGSADPTRRAAVGGGARRRQSGTSLAARRPAADPMRQHERPMASSQECGDPTCGCNRPRHPRVREQFAELVADYKKNVEDKIPKWQTAMNSVWVDVMLLFSHRTKRDGHSYYPMSDSCCCVWRCCCCCLY